MSSSRTSESLSSSVSSKVSSSSVSSSKKISSSSLSSTAIGSSLSSGTRSIGQELGSDVDEILAASASARDSARGLAAGLTERIGRGTSDLDIDELLAGSSIGGRSTSGVSSSSISSSSSKKISSISQSSVEIAENLGISSSSIGSDGPSVKSSVKSHSSSVASSAVLSQKQSSVDGEIVSSETIAERADKAKESQREKVVEDGQVVSQSGFKTEQSSAAAMRATKDMSQAELDAFFKQPAVQNRPVEALNFDKDNNTFEMKLNDLPEFSPQELTVNIIDGVITVVGTHEETSDDGTFKTHQYIRRYTVPKGLTTENVGWKLEPTGALAISAGESVKPGLSQVHLDCTIFKPRSFFKKVAQ